MQINLIFDVQQVEKELNINTKKQYLDQVKAFVCLGGNISW